jgi:hypothetical protein
MSSPERDLQSKQTVSFNHPQLLPQLTRAIPAYHATFSQRLGAVCDRVLPFRRLVHHVRVEAFGGLDLPTWSLEHPYENPLAAIPLQMPQPSTELRHRPISWIERGIERQDLPWVELDTSLQWRAFRNTVALLRKRRNRVFVLVGPFNEHMLEKQSLDAYRTMKEEVERWLNRNEVPCLVPAPLPSSEYADASHPLDAGYARLAEMILADPGFQKWLEDR